MMGLRTRTSTAHRVIAAPISSHRVIAARIRSYRGRRAAPGAVPGGAWAYRRKTAAGRARLAGARRSGVWPASFRRGRHTTIRPAERRGGGGGFWAGSFTFNASQAILPRARSPATDVSEQATAGPEQARVMGSVTSVFLPRAPGDKAFS